MARFYRNVFITGCNRGIGIEFVKQFLNLPKPPHNLFATCRSPKSAEELTKLADSNSNLHVLKLEVTNDDDLKNVDSYVGKVLEDEGLDLVINNAGVTASVTVEDVTEEQMMNAFRVNTVAPLMVIQAMLPYLKRAGKMKENSAIVNISAKTASISENTSGKLYPSRASKAALNVITKSLSIDLLDDGICAVVMHPGWVKTANGGPHALITTQDSVRGMMDVIGSLDTSKTGLFLNYNGSVIPW